MGDNGAPIPLRAAIAMPSDPPSPALPGAAGISLTRFLIEAQRAGQVGADLRLLIEVVAPAFKKI